jgi:aspartate racemase
MHRVADRIQAAVPIPFIHIADPAGRAAIQSGFGTVGLLGTRFTMTQPFLRKRLVEQHGLTVLDTTALHAEAAVEFALSPEPGIGDRR